MLQLNNAWHAASMPNNIKVELVDELGNRLDPQQVKPLDYLSRFLNKCVVNKIFNQMVADRRSGTIEVYQDKVVIREN